MSQEQPHSALYFGETRDAWWNLDQVARVFARNGLGDVQDVLDVGCGIGHWTHVVARTLPRPVSVLGVEREIKWVAEATRRTHDALNDNTLRGSFRFKQGDATSLPCEDESFDLVTCQTVLIHLADPGKALREMHRVLRPSGFLVVAEPNNQANTCASLVENEQNSIDDILRALRIEMLVEHGKKNLGLGYNSLGAWMPRLLEQNGFALRDAVTCERLHPLIPPYLLPEEQAEIKEMREQYEQNICGWPYDEMKRYYDAGGGKDFDVEWAFLRERAKMTLERIDRGEHYETRAASHYVFIAKKR